MATNKIKQFYPLNTKHGGGDSENYCFASGGMCITSNPSGISYFCFATTEGVCAFCDLCSLSRVKNTAPVFLLRIYAVLMTTYSAGLRRLYAIRQATKKTNSLISICVNFLMSKSFIVAAFQYVIGAFLPKFQSFYNAPQEMSI